MKKVVLLISLLMSGVLVLAGCTAELGKVPSVEAETVDGESIQEAESSEESVPEIEDSAPAEEEEPVLLFHSEKTRFKNAPSLRFLEENLFRYKGGAVYQEVPGEISMFCAGSPVQEMDEAVRRIARLVRTEGLRYGEIAVITGNMEEYSSIAKNAFLKAGIQILVCDSYKKMLVCD